MARRNREDWTRIIEDVARSGLPTAFCCRKMGIASNQFYRMSRNLGYTKDGHHTAKWYAAAGQVPAPPRENNELVPVPLETLRAAAEPAAPFSSVVDQPQIFLQYGNFRIALGDGFSKAALQRVVEVLGDA